ncbi:hypothetical protein C8R44DRAFT_992026 [Mycena epipterygia]|nr:hypothetical protein C8R44DRAFT_992026 [Mycena epipterygia]
MQPTKRKRTDEDSGIEPVRSDIWFDDGNIVVQAEDTQFRIYRGTLCSHSEVLKHMVEEMDDLTDVLFCISLTTRPWKSYPDNEPIPFDVIAAFLRLGRKYRIQPLYGNALRRLAWTFPSSHQKYLESLSVHTIKRSDPADHSPPCDFVVDIILLAREFNLPSLLPLAFWLAATRIHLLANKNTSSLSDADRDAVIKAVEPVRIAHTNYLFGWLDEDTVASPDCTHPSACSKNKLQNSLKRWKPPGLLMAFAWQPGAAKGLCDACVAVGRKHHNEGKKRLWEELPSFFGLPPWDQLLAAGQNEKVPETAP